MPLTFSSTVHTVNFQNLSGHEFERLVFATLLRMRAWHTLNWHGQTGGDKGRDIVGTCDDAYGRKASTIVACANWKSFTLAKAKIDIKRLTDTLPSPPDEVIVIAGSPVSAATKDKCAEYARSKGINTTQVWSGPEFEEHLRFHAASVMDRFFHGVVLPDVEKDLQDFVFALDPSTQREAGELIAGLFRRPAFTTPIHSESNLPAFKQALADTIGAIQTGIWRDREGAIIQRIPSYLAFSDKQVSDGLKHCSAKLNELRIAFDDGLRDGGIRPCGCGDPQCPTFTMDERCRRRLEELRDQALTLASSAVAALGANLI